MPVVNFHAEYFNCSSGVFILATPTQKFIKFCLSAQVLRFGEFTLKSGRKSPYFFNSGLFNTGAQLTELGINYAQTLRASQLEFDVLFGPAYKGIPLVSTCAIALQNEFSCSYPYSFNRKEAKDHGEGGLLVGAKLAGRICVIDDVITAGTAIRESLQLINSEGATLAGVIVLLDRQERGQGKLSAIEEIEAETHAPVLSVIKLADIIDYVATEPQYKQHLGAIQRYRDEYGV